MQMQMRGEPISDNSQGKILRGTASTYKESMHTPVSSVTRGQIQNIVNPIQGTPIKVPQVVQPNNFRQSVANYIQPSVPQEHRMIQGPNIPRPPLPSRLV